MHNNCSQYLKLLLNIWGGSNIKDLIPLKVTCKKLCILLKRTKNNNGVIIARCYQDCEHYVLITKIDDDFAYIFDPYYLEEEYYASDDDVAIVLHQTFTHNRLVKIERLFDENLKDFSLLEKNKRSIILINR